MLRFVLLAMTLWASLSSCHLLGGFDELEARGEGGGAPVCEYVEDCAGVDTVCARRTCVEGRCLMERAADGSSCLDSSCQGGECVGYRPCDRQESCAPVAMACDRSVGLCVRCSQDLCDSALPGTTCSDGVCKCEFWQTFCRGYGCVSKMSFDGDCDECQINCPGAGCVDPFGSQSHCGGCGIECAFGDCRDGKCTCDQARCDSLRPGTVCVGAGCQCEQEGMTWCPAHGCVWPLEFDEFCAPCQIRCGEAGCVDPYTSEEHCGACDNACGTGLCVGGSCLLVPPPPASEAQLQTQGVGRELGL